MNFREAIKLHRLEVMRRRLRTPKPCRCPACAAARGVGMGATLAQVLRSIGAQVEDEAAPTSGKAH